jgi:hypothetical protein
MGENSKYFYDYSEILWRDAVIDSISITFDEINIFLSQSNGLSTNIICEGFIGFEFTGVWDDMTVAEAKLSSSGKILDRALSVIEGNYACKPPGTGSSCRNRDECKQLDVQLIDGAMLSVALKGIRVKFRSAE